ncbi:MAG TPA: AAA family ATPase, partial [Pyrinomonadaceae bacterium]
MAKTAAHSDFLVFQSSGTKKVHTVYPYTDENGKLLYENVRYFPKDFRQRRYDETGKAVWSLGDIERVPYRLPELIRGAKSGSDIFLCEGEKDADALGELGFTATSFKAWKPQFNAYLTGLDVIVVRDHDVPGRIQAEEAAAMILPAAASVKILDVWDGRDEPEKSGPDVSDLVRLCVQDEGLDTDAIKERISLMVERTQKWRAPVNPGSDDLFLCTQANTWLDQSKTQPVPKMLFGEFWFEKEVCILFADTNVGKSILAVQIADAVSRGQTKTICDRWGKRALKVECDGQKIIYFDFELTAKQFEARFSEQVKGSDTYANHYRFHPNFYRAEINPKATDLKGFVKFEEYLNHSIEKVVAATGAKILIVDNLTYLRDETENARSALPLMKYLKELKSKHDLSILALAHTPKRDSTKPLGRNDLQGSKMIINFCDSSFAIGESAMEPNLRYFKQIKARNTEIIYHSENVYLARIVKDTNFIKFVPAGSGIENLHLKFRSDTEKTAMIAEVKKLKAEGLNNTRIA